MSMEFLTVLVNGVSLAYSARKMPVIMPKGKAITMDPTMSFSVPTMAG